MAYEFGPQENLTLVQLAKRMKAVGVFLIVVGGLTVLQGMSDLVFGGSYLYSVILAVIYILMGIWTFKAGNSFDRVVKTEGHDIGHLMQAVASLLNLYSLQFWLLIILVVLTVVVTIMYGDSDLGGSLSPVS
jgi:hypothetical protein